MNLLLQFYIATMFLLNGLSPMPLASFNFFIAVVVAPFVFLKRKNPIYDFKDDDYVVAFTFLYGIVAWLFYKAPIDQGRIQGVLQWAAALFILWLTVRRWIIVSNISFDQVARASFIGSAVLAIAVLFELFTVNTSGKYLSDYIPFSVDQFPTADLFFTGGSRPRGFAVEAGFTSMVFEAMVPLALFYFRRISLPFRLAYCALIFASLVALYSTSTFIALSFAIVFFYVIRINLRGAVQLSILFAVVLYVISANANFFYEASGYKIFEFFDISQSGYVYTPGSRQEAWAAGLRVLFDHPIGSGWGTVLQEAKTPGSEIDQGLTGTGLISLWLEVLVAVGFVPFVILMLRVSKIIINLARTPATEAKLCYFSLTTVVIHHWSVFEQWFPMLWFCLGLSQVILKATEQEGVRDMRPLRVPLFDPPHAIA